MWWGSRCSSPSQFSDRSCSCKAGSYELTVYRLRTLRYLRYAPQIWYISEFRYAPYRNSDTYLNSDMDEKFAWNTINSDKFIISCNKTMFYVNNTWKTVCKRKLVKIDDAGAERRSFWGGAGHYWHIQAQISQIPHINLEKLKIESMSNILSFYIM